MGKIELIDPGYWEDEGIDLRLNPRRAIDAAGLVPFLSQECGIRHAVVLATSGSSGQFKFVVLQKEALLASARAVAEHLSLGGSEIWLAGLSGFHVGGIGIYARAHVTGAKVKEFTAFPWSKDGQAFVESIREEKATWTSLTPTHLYDLVVAGQRSPHSLEGVLLGGGRMDPNLIGKARELGWPVRVSYGMTEASSQIATAVGDEIEWLPILPGWETKEGERECLELRGTPLLSGYAKREGDRDWIFDPAKNADGWFTAGDRCEVSGRRLRFVGRADDLVKVSGEWVSVSGVGDRVSQLGREMSLEATIATLPDERRGSEIVLIVAGNRASANMLFEQLQDEMEGISRPTRFVATASLPRTEIGKLDSAELGRLAEDY